MQPLYEGWFLALFNLLYSTLPVLYIGLFEQVSRCRLSALSRALSHGSLWEGVPLLGGVPHPETQIFCCPAFCVMQRGYQKEGSDVPPTCDPE